MLYTHTVACDALHAHFGCCLWCSIHTHSLTVACDATHTHTFWLLSVMLHTHIHTLWMLSDAPHTYKQTLTVACDSPHTIWMMPVMLHTDTHWLLPVMLPTDTHLLLPVMLHTHTHTLTVACDAPHMTTTSCILSCRCVQQVQRAGRDLCTVFVLWPVFESQSSQQSTHWCRGQASCRLRGKVQQGPGKVTSTKHQCFSSVRSCLNCLELLTKWLLIYLLFLLNN